jgi:hypothetical protein
VSDERALRFDAEWYRERLSRALVIDRPDRAELDARCEGIVDPREAWEICAPPAWEANAWSFITREGDLACEPSSVAQVCAFCASPASIEAADRLVRELVARLSALGAQRAERVRWRFWPRDLWAMGALPPTRWRGATGLLERARAALSAELVVRRAVLRAIEATSRDRLLFEAALDCARWDASGRERNPFEVLIELYATGVALVSIDPVELALPD